MQKALGSSLIAYPHPTGFCIVRVSRMMRLGSHGPEGPRPSDQQRYAYPGNNVTPQT
jgi:hypothetical protein